MIVVIHMFTITTMSTTDECCQIVVVILRTQQYVKLQTCRAPSTCFNRLLKSLPLLVLLPNWIKFELGIPPPFLKKLYSKRRLNLCEGTICVSDVGLMIFYNILQFISFKIIAGRPVYIYVLFNIILVDPIPCIYYIVIF